MDRPFIRSLKTSTFLHFMVLVGLLVASSGLQLFKKKPTDVSEITFEVQVPESGDDAEEQATPEPAPGKPIPLPPLPRVTPSPLLPEPLLPPPLPEPEPDAIAPPKPKPDKPEPPKPAPPPVPPKPTIEKGQKVKRYPGYPAGGKSKSPPKLSADDVRRYLGMGAKISDRTVVPTSEELRCLAVIKQALYGAWIQPTAEEAGGKEVLATIRLDRSGHIIGRELSTRSGKPDLDASVMRALDLVKSIPGLTPSFLAEHGTVTIVFQVE